MLRRYVKSHSKGILAFGMMCIAAAVIVALYRLPLAAVGYAALISGWVGLLFLAVDYLQFRSRCEQLESMKKRILTDMDAIPEPVGESERLYQELLWILHDEKEQLSARQTERYQELVDYYSMWAHQIKTPIAAARLILQSTADEAWSGAELQEEEEAEHETICPHAEQWEEKAETEHKTICPYAEQREEKAETERETICQHTEQRKEKTEIEYETLHEHAEPREATANARAELEEELRRIEQYVGMVMCYLRLDADSTDYVIREYDVDAIIRQALRKNASLFIRKKLNLVYEPLQFRVVTDEKWLLFVVEQILSNALKYTAPGGSVSILRESGKTLCICDTGIGIAPEDLPRIFEKGYTGYNGRTDKRASGIGLYLCSRICNSLGHRISITSVPGEGTTVRLSLENAELELE